ncbi:MAG: type II secretion system protein [Longimicrobiales bacterium]
MSARRRGRKTRRGGFTLFELLTVMTLLAILAGITVPILRGAVARADAARVISDVNTVRLAAFQYLSDGGVLPAAGAWGEIPTEFVGYLPGGFDFSYKGVEYAWSLLDAGAPAGAALGFPTLRVWAYTLVVPPEAGGSPQGQGVGQGQGGGQGQGKGQGQGGGQGQGQGQGGGAPLPSLDGAVGVLWVRYAADDPIARALQALAGVSAFWTPTQMMFVLGG